MKLRNFKGQFKRKNKKWSFKNFDEGYIDAKNRFRVYYPDHPRASTNGYILREIIAYEFYNNITIKKGYEIHHKDGNTLNDTKENLDLLSNSEHRKVHARLRGSLIKRICKSCGIEFEIEKFRLKDPSRGQFCSNSCFHKKPKSEITKKRISNGLIKAYAEGIR